MIQYAEATWTPTSLAGDFARYEIQRSEDGGATWDTLAKITSEAVFLYRDYESTRGRAARYRIRVVRTDGAASGWSSPDEIVVVPRAARWQFLSNEAPELGLELAQLRLQDRRPLGDALTSM